MSLIVIYVRLLGEGTEVCRPATAIDLGNGRFRLQPTPDYDPLDEDWEFAPGTEVRGETRGTGSTAHLFAVKP